MIEYKTKAGTSLPILDLRGKPYLQVAHRIQWFREERPDWVIKCEFVRLDDKSCIARAEIYDQNNLLKAMAHKREDSGHFLDFMEKAETSAIGRALAMLGYGTQFCGDDFTEGERLADSPISPGKTGKVPLGINPGQPHPDDGNTEELHYKITFGKFAQKTLEEVGPDELRNYVEYLEHKAKKDGKEITGKVAEFIERAVNYITAFENQ